MVLTSTFPRWKDDVEPPFVYELCRRLGQDFDMHVLAPHAAGAATEENVVGMRVTRFRYFLSRWERLAYHGGILANLKQNPWRYGLIPIFLLGQLLALVRLLRRRRYDCIHAHWLIPQGLIAMAARLLVKSMPPVIVTSHGGDLFSLKGMGFHRLKCYVAMKSAAVTVVSREMRNVLREMGVDENRIQVIPMGVDLQNCFVPSDKKTLSDTLLFVGRLVEKKGLRYLIEAMPLILSRHPHAVLRIVGDGQEKEKILKRVVELGLTESVNFLGAVENNTLPEIYRFSDVVVFPSIIADDGDREGFGLVLAEALGCGCATVVTDLPAMRDIVRDGKSALVVPQKDAGQLAEKVCRLLENAELRKNLGEQGRAYVLKKFDWQLIAGQYADLIHAVIR